MKLQPQEWSLVLQHLDAALALPPPQRQASVAQLPGLATHLKAALAQLLEERRAIETGDFLQALPPLQPPPSAAPAGFSVGHRVGPYALLRELGHGGMASVWLAERADGAHGREVALKLPYLDARSRVIGERFARERQMLSALAHPNITGVLDAGLSGAQPWLAMEYVDGQPITDWVQRQRSSVPARLRLFLQVVRAVQHAHAQLVIHRDIKPSNVLVDAQGQAKLLDFGVAKLLVGDGAVADTELTQLGGRALTPLYASPEQVAGQPLGVTTDVYSLGVLLHELLTGKLPYTLKRVTPAALEEAILAAQTAKASAVADEVPTRRALRGDLDTIIAKAMALKPAHRYGSAEALAQDIERHLQALPILARPASRRYVVGRWVQRHAWAFGSSVAVLMALSAGLGAALWQGQRAQQQSERAQATRDFLVGMFKAAELDQADALRRRQQTVQQLLEDSARRLDSELLNQPALRADLLGVTGQLLHDLSVSEAALKLRRQRVAVLEALRVEPAERAQASLDEARTLVQLGRNDEAEQTLARALAMLPTRGDAPTQALRAAVLGEQAERRLKSGVAALADAPLEEALQIARREGMPVELKARTLARVGELRDMQMRPEESLAAYREAIEAWQLARGPQSTAVALARFQMGEALWNQGRMADGERETAVAAATMRTALGADHVQTALIEVNLGRMRSILRGPKAGMPVLIHALNVLQAGAQDVSPGARVQALMYLGESMLDTGELETASAMLRQALALEAQHPSVAQADGLPALLVARVAIESGRWDEALALVARVRQGRVHAYGAAHPSVLFMDFYEGIVRDHQGRLAQAEAIYQAVIDKAQRGGEAYASVADEARSFLRSMRLDQGRYAQALPDLEREHAAHYALPAAERRRQAELLVNLRRGRALAGLGRWREARADLERAVALGEQEQSPQSHMLAMARGRLAHCMVALGELSAAARQIELATAALATHPELASAYREPVLQAQRALTAKRQIASAGLRRAGVAKPSQERAEAVADQPISTPRSPS